MKLDLDTITSVTLEHYASRAEDFFAGTKDHDVSQNINALLKCIQGVAPFTILDLGCDAGRDLRTFATLGHRAIGLEGCDKFVAMARGFLRDAQTHPPQQPARVEKIGRDDPCPCGRGKKYKKCCGSV